MKALVLNCTLKKSPAKSNTQVLADELILALKKLGCETKTARIADLNILPGVLSTSEGKDDQWPLIHEEIVGANILIIATPTWVGHPSSMAQKVLERLDGMISETKADGRPLAYDKVAGVVVTGNEAGAHHVISEVSGGLVDIGFTVPGQSWTYWNMGPGPGASYTETSLGHKWSRETAQQAAKNIYAVAHALKQYPIKTR